VRRRIFSKVSWYLVLFSGIFQILGFALEQWAIQTEEKLRDYDYQIIQTNQQSFTLSLTHNRTLFLKETLDDMRQLSSTTSQGTRNEIIILSIFEISNMLKSIINDAVIFKRLKDETRMVPIKYKYLVNKNKLLEEKIEQQKAFTSIGVKKILLVNQIVDLLHISSNYYQKTYDPNDQGFEKKIATLSKEDLDLITDFARELKVLLAITNKSLFNLSKIVKTETSKLIKDSIGLGLFKQKLLLISVALQLVSFLFLLILFRSILLSSQNKLK
jgi:hypothetical protein